jgi:hypothetical protein
MKKRESPIEIQCASPQHAPKRRPMSNCQQRDASVFDCLVNLTFDVDADGTGAFVQQSKLRPETIRSHYQMRLSDDEQICSRLDCILVIKKPGHAHALLFAARQDILPI